MQLKEREKETSFFLNGLPADLEKAGSTFNKLENGLGNRVLKYFKYKQGASSKKKKRRRLESTTGRACCVVQTFTKISFTVLGKTSVEVPKNAHRKHTEKKVTL